MRKSQEHKNSRAASPASKSETLNSVSVSPSTFKGNTISALAKVMKPACLFVAGILLAVALADEHNHVV
jgi:hypothetical protein